MLRTFLLASVASVAIAASAQAADLPVSVPASVPQTVVPLYNWTGVYVGLNAGYSWMNGDARYTSGPGTALGVLPGGYGIEADGFIGGGQLGFNYQMNQFVIGIEADIQYTDLKGTTSITSGFIGGTSFGSATTGLDWLGTVRGRVGFAFDRFLVYGTGGFAFGDVNVTGSTADTFAPPFAYSGSRSETRTGWTAGAGVEWGFTQNISVKLEYLYYDLGNVNLTLLPASAAAAGTVLTQRHEIDGHIVRAGINFRF